MEDVEKQILETQGKILLALKHLSEQLGEVRLSINTMELMSSLEPGIQRVAFNKTDIAMLMDLKEKVEDLSDKDRGFLKSLLEYLDTAKARNHKPFMSVHQRKSLKHLHESLYG